MGLDSTQFANLCLLIGAFSPLTFKVNFAMCEFDPVIMMLAVYFALQLMQFLHSVLIFIFWHAFAVTIFPFHI